jgi:hypothetical protein
VAGTATAVSGRVARRQQASANQAADAQAYEQQQQMAAQQAYAQPAAPPMSQADMIDELKELAALKEQGVLTEAEFAAQKAKILGA